MPQHDSRPNFLVIMADQWRYDYLGAAGADWVRTPNLDRLAAQGMRCTHCGTNAPVCAPARIGLATGRHPWRMGALGNDSFLPLSVPTYYQHLRDHRYRVGCVGKLDLAKPDHYNGWNGDRPWAYSWGFTHPCEAEGKMHAGISPTPIGPYTRFLHEHGLLERFHQDYSRRARISHIEAAEDSVLPDWAFEDGWIGQRAQQWLSEVPGDFPFHYFVSFVGPHDPFDPPTNYAEQFRQSPMPAPVPVAREGKAAWVQRRQKDYSPDYLAVRQRQYCAAMAVIDHWVGELLATLEKRGLADNTFVIFTSDHGEMLGDLGMYTKSVPYEASWRVPLVVRGPGIAAGSVSDALIELNDLNPTITELAGLPAQSSLDAKSCAAVWRGQASEHRAELLCRLHNFTAIRSRTHKLVVHTGGDADELYDLQADPGEQHNIRATARETVIDLRRRLGQRLKGETCHY